MRSLHVERARPHINDWWNNWGGGDWQEPPLPPPDHPPDDWEDDWGQQWPASHEDTLVKDEPVEEPEPGGPWEHVQVEEDLGWPKISYVAVVLMGLDSFLF